ncbi:4'-phosphopantetheinyl transferase family protein [Alicyclobacillus fodiniaquatilis]|uniref:4'-phosphopantetheinyl transferase family protein n=1 Tax=Alicyclobacillus fodiniaquatilis TaxID=1661150 RepID=A0ABW4JL12_9BACL
MIKVIWVVLPDEDQLNDGLSKLYLLDSQELNTFNQYKVNFKKLEFLTGRLLVKEWIGRRLGVPPQFIKLQKNVYGKPFLDYRCIPVSSPPLFFNLSNTKQLVIVAFHERPEIGVDVEQTDAYDFNIMPQIFTEAEIESVNEQNTHVDRINEFFRLWTRKEALMKAEGLGFSMSPLSFTVPIAPERVENAEYVWETFVPTPGYIASVVVRKEDGLSIQFEGHEISWGDLFSRDISWIDSVYWTK